MPIASPSSPTTLTSFTLISSLINNSFALMLNTPPILPKSKKNHAKTDSPHDTIPQDFTWVQYQTVRALRHGENGAFFFFFLAYFTTNPSPCQYLFKKFFCVFLFFSQQKNFIFLFAPKKRASCDKTYDIFRVSLSFLTKSQKNSALFSNVYLFARKFRQKIVYFEYLLFSAFEV